MNPFFSVIIPLYNKEEHIQNTLQSVLNQSFKNFEAIIINDGSTDSSLELAKQIKDNRIRIITTPNMGLSAARNTGIKHANTDYIALLDADDLWKEDFLETINNLIVRNKNKHVFATTIIPLKKNQVVDLGSKKFNLSKEKHITNFRKLAGYIITPSGFVVNKTVFTETGNFDEKINYAEDADFYIRCLKSYNLVLYVEPKIYYRIGESNQMTSPNPNFKKIIPDFFKYLNKENHKDLKPYLDSIHYKLVVLYKMEKNYKLVKLYKDKINSNNLTTVQRIKFHLPISIFWIAKSIYKKTFF